MSKPQKPVGQEYIAKVRYINNLPPPPVHPKFIRYHTTEAVTPKQESEHLLSLLFRKENFHEFLEHIDDDFGMPVTPLHVRGFLDGLDETVVFARNSVPLHALDRALLRDAGIGKINKLEPGVSFLRRTEYIAERLAGSRAEEKAAAALKPKDEAADPEAQLRAVEQTFEDAQELLAHFLELRHPRKTKLRAVGAFPLLPDTAAMDAKYLAVKFTGLASVERDLAAQLRTGLLSEAVLRQRLLSAIYKPITSEDGEWVGLYQADGDTAAQARATLASTRREEPANLLDDESDAPVYRFRHSKTYDMQYHRFSKPYEELALKFQSEPDGLAPASRKRVAALYSPISGRVELKKHRASGNSEINRFLADSTVDAIDLQIREPTTGELRKRDHLRSEYDPMEYEDDESDSEGKTQDGEDPKSESTEGAVKADNGTPASPKSDIAAEFDSE